MLGLCVCLSTLACLAGPWPYIAGRLLLSSTPSVSCCSLSSSLVSICSLLECLDGLCVQYLFCPWCGCAVGLCQAWAGHALGPCSCRAALPVLLPGTPSSAVLRQKTWGVSVWNLLLCSFKTKCFPDLEFQGGGMFFFKIIFCCEMAVRSCRRSSSQEWSKNNEWLSFRLLASRWAIHVGDLSWERREWHPF